MGAIAPVSLGDRDEGQWAQRPIMPAIRRRLIARLPVTLYLTARARNSLTILGNSLIIRLARKAKSYGLRDLARYKQFVVRYEF